MLPPASAALFRLVYGSVALILASVVSGAPEQSISTSRQFIVYGTEVRVRGAICDLAERTKRDLLALLDQRDEWVTPIVINAQYPQANLPEQPRLALNVSQTGFGLKLQLDLTLDAKLRRPDVRRELLRALLLEFIYRGGSQIPAGTAYVSPPEWLLDGVPGVESDMPVDRVSNLLALPVTARTILPLAKFLHQRPELLDAPGRLLYRAYSYALVDWLRSAREGPSRLAGFVVRLRGGSNDPVAELQKHYPELFEPGEAAEMLWQKRIARLATDQPFRLLSSGETERMLEGTLRLKISHRGVAKTYELSEFAKYLQHPSAKTALALMAADLRQLALRANPIYRPIISEYATAIALLARGKTRGLTARLERLRQKRQGTVTQMRQIDDYLNWFEATKLPGPSGAFVDYMKAAESAARPRQTKRDPISVYLDVLETEFKNRPMHTSLPNTIDYIEMPSANLDATKDFFTQLLGWSFQDYGPEYSSFDDGRMTGGFFASEITSTVEKGAPLVIFYTTELEKMSKEVARLGGKITREIFEFPGGRRFHFEAPGTGEFAIWSEK